MRVLLGALLVATLLPLAACSDGGGSASRSFDFSAFEAGVESFLAEEGLEGAGVVLVDREQGVIYERSFGAFSDDRIYLLASSSKMLVAGVLMRLADEGLL